jgi:hypothetical protein
MEKYCFDYTEARAVLSINVRGAVLGRYFSGAKARERHG